MIEMEAKAVGGRLSLEEQTTFGGVTSQFSTLMDCPELLEHDKIETEREASLAKNLRRQGRRERQQGVGKRETNSQTLEMFGAEWTQPMPSCNTKSGGAERRRPRDIFPLPLVCVKSWQGWPKDFAKTSSPATF